MKKYKLIKKYPGSPKLGTILTYERARGDYAYDKNNLNCFRHILDVKNYPEFWEKVVEKDYEILSMCDNKGLNICFITNELQSKSLYHDGFNIRSVKRLSDSEVFTVGDFVKETITGQCKGWEIKEFSLKDSRCFSCGVNINNIEKLKEVLFTTEDGVDIFEGDTYYVANIKSWQCYKHYANIDGNTGLDKYFSTKEAAEEYILMNKPCLSINNVLHCIPKLSPRLLSIIKGYVNLKKI